MKRKIKIGIDVGGTFTHAVAIDTLDMQIIGKECVPTSHNAKQGVAEGVILSMQQLLQKASISPEEIVLIAHSTTQATNALLEGDVAKVGVIALGKGLEGNIARRQAFLDDIYLAPKKVLPVVFQYLNTSNEPARETIQSAIKKLVDEGAQVFVSTEAFGPDNHDNEIKVLEEVHSMGYMGTSACTLSQLYGIKVRTRTAIVNASMMPKMIETANLTEEAIRKSGIKAPLMVMRSDGGIMDVEEMRKRPILTMLSGPAAGVSAALMYSKISDGIFVEVGGTSTDISVIKNGMPQLKAAQIGHNRLSVKTIDIRTIGIGGGSIPRIQSGKVIDVGPRSAHIANLAYVAYSDQVDYSSCELEKFQPKDGDPDDYLKLTDKDKNYTLTPSAASYYLNLVKEIGHGEANRKAIKSALEAVAEKLSTRPDQLAKDILKHCANKAEKVINSLIREYKLDRSFISLIGGGGGASAIVPFTSQNMKIDHSIAQNAEVISAIGAAMGMIRDTIEKSMVNPSENEIIEIRQAAMESVIAMGAKPETVDVHVEIDTANQKVTAIATGASELATKDRKKILDTNQLKEIAAKSLKSNGEDVSIYGNTKLLYVIGFEKQKSHFLGLMQETIQPVVVMDREGTIKRKFSNVKLVTTTISGTKAVISELLEELRTYSDAGEIMPDVFVVVSGKIVDLSGLIDIRQILTIVEYDLKDLVADDPSIVIATRKK